MNTDNNYMPGDEKENQNNPGQEKSTEISLPKIERPEGPFEHSAVTARITEEEKEEKKDAGQEGS